MATNQSAHAQQVVDRFRSILADSGIALSNEHSDELALLIEAALDAVIVDSLEKTARKLEQWAEELRREEVLKR